MTATSRTTTSALDPRLSAKNLLRGADGVWYACGREAISYSKEGNAKCFELEEGSFWFAHRGACLQATVRRLPPSGVIYDIGGGNGFVTKTLIDAGFETVLVEPGETGAYNAVRRGVPTVICATLATAGFREGSLPAAGLFDVLEHIEDDAGFLAEVHRCLEPGGRLYLTVPAFSWLWSHDDVVAGHFRRYTLNRVAARMEAAGFAPLYATYLFSLLPLPLLVMRGAPSFFGRRALPPQSYGKLHQARGGFTDRVWAAELRRVENGQVIPFGSSCLLVMHKR